MRALCSPYVRIFPSVCMGLGVLAVGAVFPVAARADQMDLSLSRLRVAAASGSDCDPFPNGSDAAPRDFCADNDAWKRLASQFGMAVAPPVLSPARTIGSRGYSLALESWMTGIDSTAEYWQLGTEGDDLDAAEGRNRFPSSTLIWMRAAARKGLPLGFELGTSAGFLMQTTVWTLGVELKWALFEGYRTGFGVFPDVAVRAMVNTVVGDQDYNLTVPSVDLVVSKPIVMSGVFTLTPFVAGQMLWLIADSELVDLTPDIDAFDECLPNPTAGETVCTRDPSTLPVGSGGEPVRVPGEDYNNNAVFDSLRYKRQRFAVGAQGRFESFVFSGSFQMEIAAPTELSDMSRQWTVAGSAGLQY